jgi:hypothetical protein
VQNGTDAAIGVGNPPLLSTSPAVFSPTAVTSLLRTRPWVRFMSIVGFVTAGPMALIGLIGVAIGVVTRNVEAAVLAVIYPPFALLYVFPSLYLFKYANRIRDFGSNGDPLQLELALDAQRAFWKFAGVFTLVSLVLTVVLLVGAVLVGVVAGIVSSQA